MLVLCDEIMYIYISLSVKKTMGKWIDWLGYKISPRCDLQLFRGRRVLSASYFDFC